jgi:hypothetical protein
MAAEPSFDPEAILRALNDHDVRYVVIGGFAVAAHGVVRATADLDVVVERSWENAAHMAGALEALGAHDVEEPDLPLNREVLVRRADRRFDTVFGQLHVLHEVAGVPSYGELTPAEVIEVGGERVPVVALDDLRRMKRAAGRDKDRVDLAELDALHGGEAEPGPA